jgi:hypothetical protein
MEHKDAMERPFNTEAQRHRGTWDGTQGRYGTPIQHRGTEAQRHRGTKGRIEHRTQNNNLFF